MLSVVLPHVLAGLADARGPARARGRAGIRDGAAGEIDETDARGNDPIGAVVDVKTDLLGGVRYAFALSE